MIYNSNIKCIGIHLDINVFSQMTKKLDSPFKNIIGNNSQYYNFNFTKILFDLPHILKPDYNSKINSSSHTTQFNKYKII